MKCNCKCEPLFVFSGNANDLYTDNGIYKSIRLVNLVENNDEIERNQDIVLTSYASDSVHDMFDKLLGKNIEITVKILSENYDK